MIYNLKHWMRCFCVGLFCASISTLFLASCNKPNPEVSNDAEVSSSLPEDFYEFYDQFHSDSVFQMSHIIFPIKGDPSDPIINQDEWILHKPFDSMNGTFERDFRILGSKIVAEYIYEQTGNFAMERRFGKLSDGWNLIYYDPMSQVSIEDTSATEQSQ